MPNREWNRLTSTQAAAVERCIANARRAPGIYREEAADGDAYAYSLGPEGIEWGFDAPHNIARGLVRHQPSEIV